MLSRPVKEKSSDPQKAYDKLVDYLSRRDHSEKELREKLARRFEKPAIEQALVEAHQRKWMKDPQELAERVTQRLLEKGKGPRYISQYLYKKGLPEQNPDRELVKENARHLLTVKFGKSEEFSYEEKQKAFRFLSQRGYDLETINSII